VSTPNFTFESARKVFEQLAPKPPPDLPRIAAARQLLERTPAKARDEVGAELIRQAKDADEVDTLHGMVREMLTADAKAAEEQLVQQVAEPLRPERLSPYLDDDQRLRSPSGEVVDVMGTDWHDQPWYSEAAQLLRDAGYEHADGEG
jgi:hypothetical protein